MKKKNTIRLTESDLRRVVTETVKRVLKENTDNYNLFGGVDKYPQYNQDAKRYWEFVFKDNPESAIKKAQAVISKFENSDYKSYVNEKEYYHDKALATFAKKYIESYNSGMQ